MGVAKLHHYRRIQGSGCDAYFERRGELPLQLQKRIARTLHPGNLIETMGALFYSLRAIGSRTLRRLRFEAICRLRRIRRS
jgi:hypothetical protein